MAIRRLGGDGTYALRKDRVSVQKTHSLIYHRRELAGWESGTRRQVRAQNGRRESETNAGGHSRRRQHSFVDDGELYRPNNI